MLHSAATKSSAGKFFFSRRGWKGSIIMNKRRGVFIRTYDLSVSCLIEGGGWSWLNEDHEENCECEWCEGAKTPDFCRPEAIDGLLAVRNSNGVYDCFAVDRHDTGKEPKEGPCSIANFLRWDGSLEDLPKNWRRRCAVDNFYQG
jgi:hypothetical protein